MKNKQIESGLESQPQLYNLEDDVKETINLAVEHPEVLKEMDAKLEDILNR